MTVSLTKKSIFGTVGTMELPITQYELDDGLAQHASGVYIQDAFPQLNADQREFLMTGITPEEWDEKMGVDEEEAS